MAKITPHHLTSYKVTKKLWLVSSQIAFSFLEPFHLPIKSLAHPVTSQRSTVLLPLSLDHGLDVLSTISPIYWPDISTIPPIYWPDIGLTMIIYLLVVAMQVFYHWRAADLREFHLCLSWSSIPLRISRSGSDLVQRSLRLRPSLLADEYSLWWATISTWNQQQLRLSSSIHWLSHRKIIFSNVFYSTF